MGQLVIIIRKLLGRNRIMDKLLVRKDVYEELLEKGFGKKDLSKLTKKKITDKNGHTRTVYVRNGEQPAEVKQPKTQELSEEKRAKYEEMLEKVKRGPEERALFAQGDFLNKKDAIAYLENKLGKNSGEKKPTLEDYKENYLDAKNEAGKDIAENNKINKVSDLIEFSSDEMKAIQDAANKIGYKPGEEGKLLNAIEDKNIYSSLTKKNSEAWKRSGKEQKTFSSTDLLKEKIKSMNGNFDSKGTIKNYKDAHAYLTKLKPSSSELKDDFEDHRDIVLKRFERGEESFDEVLKNYEKEMKISVPHMVESGIMTFEEGNNYIKAWEDLKKQI